MSEFEFHSLFVDYVNIAHTLLMNLVTLLSGFLIVSYLVAHKLNRTMARIVVALFTGAMLMMSVSMFFSWLDAAGIARQIIAFPSDWHFANRSGAIAPVLTGIVYLCASIAGYVAALAFFASQRKQVNQ